MGDKLEGTSTNVQRKGIHIIMVLAHTVSKDMDTYTRRVPVRRYIVT